LLVEGGVGTMVTFWTEVTPPLKTCIDKNRTSIRKDIITVDTSLGYEW
jgi:hypothetical protein